MFTRSFAWKVGRICPPDLKLRGSIPFILPGSDATTISNDLQVICRLVYCDCVNMLLGISHALKSGLQDRHNTRTTISGSVSACRQLGGIAKIVIPTYPVIFDFHVLLMWSQSTNDTDRPGRKTDATLVAYGVCFSSRSVCDVGGLWSHRATKRGSRIWQDRSVYFLLSSVSK